jgi:hypothetical protein
MIFSSFFGVSLVSSALLINPVKNQILLDVQCCCVNHLSKTWIFHWLREHGMPIVNLLRTHPWICAVPTLCFSEKTPRVAVLFAIFKCSMQQRNLRCIRIKLGWYTYIYIHQTPMLVLYLTFEHNQPGPGVGSKTDIWLVYKRPALIYTSQNLPPEFQHDILSCQSWSEALQTKPEDS